MENGQLLTALIFEFFRLCKLEPLQIRPGVWQVQAPEPLMRELDGWRARERLLQFSFQERLAKTYGAELVSRGSYRLESILQLIQRQGVLSTAHLPHQVFHEPDIRNKALLAQNEGRAYLVNSTLLYNQYLELELLVSLNGLQKKESLHTALINLSTGQPLNMSIPTELLVAGGIMPQSVRKRNCSFKNAYLAAASKLADEVNQDDQTWAEDAGRELDLEAQKLADYYEGDLESPEYAAKLTQLHRRLAPRVEIDAVRAALLYLPCFQYRLVLVGPQGQERLKTVFSDPIAGTLS